MNPETRLTSCLRRRLVAAPVAALAIGASGCATGILENRGRDARDMATSSLGDGLPAMMRVGPQPARVNRGGDTVGLRHRVMFHPDSEWGDPDDVDSLLPMLTLRTSFDDVRMLWRKDDRGTASVQLWRLEACVGLGVTFRAGMQPAEIPGGAVGIAGFDVLGDDKRHRKSTGD